MKLQDVLHFYVGCNLFSGSGSKYRLDSVGIDSFRATLSAASALLFTSGKLSDFDFKPILRKLSDMHREEIINLFKLKGLNLDQGVFRTSIENWFVQIEYNDSNNELKTDWTDIRFLNAFQTAYLLKQHFDLFELIDSKQAIDSATAKISAA